MFKDVTTEVVKNAKELYQKATKDSETRANLIEFDEECQLRYAVKQARKEQGITQEELEKRTGIPQQTISRIENNFEISPSLKTLMRYLDALGYHLTLAKNSKPVF